MNKLTFVVSALRHLAEGGVPSDFSHISEYFDDSEGVCDFIEVLTNFDYFIDAAIGHARDEWPEYNGWAAYPINCPAEDLERLSWVMDTPDEPRQAFGQIAKWVGEYGEARRDYCGFIATYLEENYS